MKMTLLGDEAFAQGALDAGLAQAYGYPGTPSTEIMEYLQERGVGEGTHVASWCANEKTALETALGASLAGRRSLVTMKHVGLNVAADPFMNGAALDINGGLVLAVADDPGMHSSQNEQDTRYYAAMARIPCIEPRNQQEAYDAARHAFEASERFHVPVLVRLVTRLSHARSVVETAPQGSPPPREKTKNRPGWLFLPVHARKNCAALLEKQESLEKWAAGVFTFEESGDVSPDVSQNSTPVVITSGLGGNYYDENRADYEAKLGVKPARLHIGAYPLPADMIRNIAHYATRNAASILVIEEGQPFIEENLRGIISALPIHGKMDGTLPRNGELDNDKVRAALGLPPHEGISAALIPAALPGRPPQLCEGCPHRDSFTSIKDALADYPRESKVVCSDIGCYSLGATPPFDLGDSIVCMGASIGMARGAAEAGIEAAVAVIGDSTFLHSGITALLDAVGANSPAGAAITVCILDNSTVAMTGCQIPAAPSARLEAIVRGLGVDAAHLRILETSPAKCAENTAIIKEEIAYRGLSVVILKRECLESLRLKRKEGKQTPASMCGGDKSAAHDA